MKKLLSKYSDKGFSIGEKNTKKINDFINENKIVNIQLGTGFMQGIFVQYGITLDDDVTDIRNGGFGSTTK